MQGTAFSRRVASEFCVIAHPLRNRGRRESRVRAAPAVSRAIRAQEHAHEHTGSAENIRPSLRNGFTAYIVLSLVRRALLPPSPARSFGSHELDASVGRQNHTILPSASATVVFVTSASTASHRNVRDDRDPPLFLGETGGVMPLICPSRLGKNSAFSKLDVRFCS